VLGDAMRTARQAAIGTEAGQTGTGKVDEAQRSVALDARQVPIRKRVHHDADDACLLAEHFDERAV
jgi:hypothetical protein